MIQRLLCPDAVPGFLNIFDFSIAPSLLFYAYLPVLFIALAFTIYLLYKDQNAGGKLVALLSAAFSFWVLDVLILWTAAPADIVMFWWQILPFFEILMYAAGIAVVLSFGNRKISFTNSLLLSAPVVITLLFLPTKFNISAFDVINCEGIIGSLWYFIYGFEILAIIVIAAISVWRMHGSDKVSIPQLPYLTTGLCIFLATFTATNILGDFTGFYNINLIGPLGMVVFFAFLTYLTVHFKTFGIRLFGTQALVGVILALIGSLLFLTNLSTVRGVVAVTLLALIPFGILLVRSVKREIQLRTQLEIANKRQQETLRFITHEVKGYLTDGAAALDAIKTEVFGPVNAETKAMVGEALTKNRNAVREIQNFLRIADFKTGKVSYAVTPFDLKDELVKLLVTASETATAKGLTFKQDIAPGDYAIKGDSDQLINHVIGNLVNNAINYTPTGEVMVHAERKPGSILVSVKDSGVGLSEDDKALLFTEGGHGKESRTVNPHSTGYGLYIAKQIVDAHKGRIWAESEGRGLGSTFLVELPTTGKLTSAK
jgi:signal transduction histidine kinase